MPRLDYFAPGVYVEEVPGGSRPIEGVPTNIAGFVGFTEDIRNGAKKNQPILVTSWNQYLEYFSRPQSTGFTQFKAYLPFSVYGFFLNGGGRCWVVSLGTGLPKPRKQIEGEISNISENIPRLEARNQKAGSFGALSINSLNFEFKDDASFETKENGLVIEIENSPNQNWQGSGIDRAELFSIIVKSGEEIIESHDYLSMNPAVSTIVDEYETEARFLRLPKVCYVETKISNSEYIRVRDPNDSFLNPVTKRPQNGRYELKPLEILPVQETLATDIQGNAGSESESTGIQALFDLDEINIITCPDLWTLYDLIPDEAEEIIKGVISIMIGLCEGSISGDIPNPPNRMIVIDTPPPDKCRKPQQVKQWLDNLKQRSMFAALYYPWVKVPNPAAGGRPTFVPPGGHVIGVWARTDEQRGVYKAPANEPLRGITDLAYETNFREQELLNPLGINCIRSFPNRGMLIWGARTLVEPDKTEWRYISVRRLISYIEKSIELGTQWAVFEPNDEDLWARISRAVSNFLERLWREGALFGATPEQAFFVKCDAELNTPETMILGRLYIEVGVSPVRPAEFVIFRISQKNSSDGA